MAFFFLLHMRIGLSEKDKIDIKSHIKLRKNKWTLEELLRKCHKTTLNGWPSNYAIRMDHGWLVGLIFSSPIFFFLFCLFWFVWCILLFFFLIVWVWRRGISVLDNIYIRMGKSMYGGDHRLVQIRLFFFCGEEWGIWIGIISKLGELKRVCCMGVWYIGYNGNKTNYVNCYFDVVLCAIG